MLAAIRICPLAATKKTPWPSQSVIGFANRRTATLPLPADSAPLTTALAARLIACRSAGSVAGLGGQQWLPAHRPPLLVLWGRAPCASGVPDGCFDVVVDAGRGRGSAGGAHVTAAPA